MVKGIHFLFLVMRRRRTGDEHEFGEGGSKSSQSREEGPTAGEFVLEDDANSDESQ